MKNAKKWAIIGFVCLLLGAIILLATFASAGFDIEKLYSRQLITTLYEFEDDFDKIHISVLTSDVTFARAGDGKTKIEVREIEKIPHTVSVDENTLEITDKDMRKWVDRLNFADAKVSITVYLPKDAYESADVLTRTGDINIVPGFSFGSLQANTSTGKIVVTGVQAETMIALGTTGKIMITDAVVQKELVSMMTTGDIDICRAQSQYLDIASTTGDVMLTDVEIKDLMSVKVTTGDISFRRCDAGEAYLKATTGDIEGVFLTEKRFEAKATTGHVSVPSTQSGGLCQATTTTGHIDISIGG